MKKENKNSILEEKDDKKHLEMFNYETKEKQLESRDK